MRPSQKIRNSQVYGAALMILGMFIFPIGDTAAKFLSNDYPPLLLSWARFAVGTVLLLPFVFFLNSTPTKISKRLIFEQTIRAALIVAATVLFIAAIATIPLADTVGAYFTAPIIAALLSVIILKEKLSEAKIIATGLGFCGMILIVRPSASMEVGFIYALGAGLCFGSFLVATKWASCEVSSFKVVAFQTLFGTIILTPFVLFRLDFFNWDDLVLFLVVGLASAAANILTISALRFADAGLLAPLVYFEIVGATLFGYLVFSDIPSGLTIAGICVVVLGGLLLIERKS